MQALKDTEELRLIGRIESCTIITDEIRHVPVDGHRAALDPRLRAFTGELPCVPKQVFERDPQQWRVALRNDTVLDDHRDLAGGLSSTELRRDTPRQCGQIDRRATELGARHAGESQQIVDEAT